MDLPDINPNDILIVQFELGFSVSPGEYTFSLGASEPSMEGGPNVGYIHDKVEMLGPITVTADERHVYPFYGIAQLPDEDPIGQPAEGVKTHVHIGHHFYGAGNFGDDLMMGGFIAAVRPYLDHLRLTCSIPHNLGSQRFRFPEIEWHGYDEGMREELVGSCDAWVGSGGSPFQTDLGEWLLQHLEDERLRCERHKVPMYFLGVGTNNQEAITHPIVRKLLRTIQHTWTRDVLTAETLRQLVGNRSVTRGSDLAHIYLSEQPMPRPDPGTTSLLLHFENSEQFDPTVIEEFIKGRGGRVSWCFQECRRIDGSEEMNLRRLSEEVRKQLVISRPDYGNQTLVAYLDSMNHPSMVITSRFHGGITAAWMRAKVVLVERNLKISSLSTDLGAVSLRTLDSLASLERAVSGSAIVEDELLQSRAHLARKTVLDFLNVIGVR